MTSFKPLKAAHLLRNFTNSSDTEICLDITLSLFRQVCGVLTFRQQCVTLRFNYYSFSPHILAMEI